MTVRPERLYTARQNPPKNQPTSSSFTSVLSWQLVGCIVCPSVFMNEEEDSDSFLAKMFSWIFGRRERKPIICTKPRLRVLVTGAAGQIGYSIVLEIANGGVFGSDQPIDLVLLDIPAAASALEGVMKELADCALPTLRSVIAWTNEDEAFKDIDAAFLIGAMPRKEGMERRQLLASNVKIFKSQGQALAKYAKRSVKVLVVANPANTNAYICAKYAAPHIKPNQITAMTRLDHNRAVSQIAIRCHVQANLVKNVIIWGNHSATQYPDARFANVYKEKKWIDASIAVNDDAWLRSEFVTVVQKRGAEIISLRKASSALSAAKAACDHMRDWFNGTPEGTWVSMAVPSDGSYGIPRGIVFSFPIRIDPFTREWFIVQGLQIDSAAREKLNATLKELEEEKAEAFAACGS